jgi:hypothetical protein
VPAGARPSLRPFFSMRAKRTAKLGRLRREAADMRAPASDAHDDR